MTELNSSEKEIIKKFVKVDDSYVVYRKNMNSRGITTYYVYLNEVLACNLIAHAPIIYTIADIVNEVLA